MKTFGRHWDIAWLKRIFAKTDIGKNFLSVKISSLKAIGTGDTKPDNLIVCELILLTGLGLLY